MKETLPHIRGYLSEMTHLNSPWCLGDLESSKGGR